jgi:hypothetical protein
LTNKRLAIGNNNTTRWTEKELLPAGNKKGKKEFQLSVIFHGYTILEK